jgi:hypothetical protein
MKFSFRVRQLLWLGMKEATTTATTIISRKGHSQSKVTSSSRAEHRRLHPGLFNNSKLEAGKTARVSWRKSR